MGKNNKARRAAKAKQRRQQARGPQGAGPGTGPRHARDSHPAYQRDPEVEVSEHWYALEIATHDNLPTAAVYAERLAIGPEALADAAGERVFGHLLPALWRGGWQPAELRREVRRKTTATATRLIEVAILADHDRRSGDAIDERWSAQLGGFSMRQVSTHGGWLVNWRRHEAVDRATCYQVVAAAATAVSRLPLLDVLIPPPGAPPTAATYGLTAGADGSADPVLARIRKLLSKAESTEFEEEALALTVKAQELMTRHAIDQAMLSVEDPGDTPLMIRLPVDAPYADAKSVLLAVIANANLGQAVSMTDLGLCTVVGHASDLNLIEMLFTSLLAQAQNAVAEAGRASGYGARARSQSFRASFYISYASRIGERLQGVSDEVLAEAGAGAGYLPVLRAREQAVDDFMAERYGDTVVSSRVHGGYDLAGSAYGRQAADDARLDSGELSR